MDSISYNGRIAQAPCPTSFRYALKLSPQQIQRLSRDELLALCMEQYFLLWLVIAIIRNPLAAIATRVVALDLIFSMVEKNVRGKIQDITERSRVYISGDGGTAKRLGIHANTVSKTYKNLETYHMVERTYIYDETTQKEYLDLTLTPLQLQAPEKLQDKTLRTVAAPNHKQTSSQASVSPPLPDIICPACGSDDVLITCRSCGSVSAPEDVTTTPQDHAGQAVNEAGDLLHKFYAVDTSNAPLLCEDNECDTGNNDNDGDARIDCGNNETDGGIQDAAGTKLHLSDAAQMVVDSPPPPDPPHEESVQTGQEDENSILIAWLAKRIGHGKLIYATGSAEYSKKYYNKPKDYQPDYVAYLAGDRRHILGSYLLREDGTTSVLAFDIDDPVQHAQRETYLRQLAAAGAAPVYWQRRKQRGHLELYFDRPVNPERALAWCLSVCPDLQTVVECYPAHDKRNQPLAWPVYQRAGNTIIPCSILATLPSRPGQLLASPGIQADHRRVAVLVQKAITPAALIEAFAPAKPVEDRPAPAPARTQEARVLPQATTEDLAKAVIAEFNVTTTWDEVVALCGGFNREGKFKAVWRGERTPSVAIDANGQFACDYGRIGTEYPKKLDRYDVWCWAHGGREFKRYDLAARIEAYRERMKGQSDALPSPPLPHQESAPELPPAQPALQPDPNETAEEIVARLRQTGQQSRGRVMTPAGAGTLWQIWPSRIGVVLDSDPEHVKFFTDLEEMHRIVAILQEQGEGQ